MDREEYDVVSTQIDWVGRRGTIVGVSFHSDNRYEFDGVPEPVWRELVATVERAAEWERSRRYADEKPHEVSVGRFYHNRLKDRFACWSVDVHGGHCTPMNAYADEWEAKHGPRGTTRIHRYWDGARNWIT